MEKYKINFFITNSCNAQILPALEGAPEVCCFCFRPTSRIITNQSIINRIIEQISKISIQEPITITGGEPLVSEHLNYFIDLLNEKKYKISIHTNGLLLNEKKSIIPKIDYLSLPYDGHTAEVADYYRGSGYFNIEQKAFSLIDQYNVKIGLHTLLTPYNLSSINAMAENLYSKSYFNKIWYWYIKRFKKINSALQNGTRIFELEDNIYTNTIEKVKADFHDIPIIFSGEISKKITTLFISLDGDVFIYKDGQKQNLKIGNLVLSDIETIVSGI